MNKRTNLQNLLFILEASTDIPASYIATQAGYHVNKVVKELERLEEMGHVGHKVHKGLYFYFRRNCSK